MAQNGMNDPRLQPLRWPLRLTLAGVVAERTLRVFWPLISVVLFGAALAMLGLHDLLPTPWVWAISAVIMSAAGIGLIWGGMRFRWPQQAELLQRLDAQLPERPIAALMDLQAIGANDAGSAALWQAHQQRMIRAAAQAKAPQPDLRIAALDPFALRYVAIVAFAIAVVFGSFGRVNSLTAMVPGGADTGLSGPSWEGWIEPPSYTGLPVLYLNDQPAGALELPVGSRISLRFYGAVGALSLAQDVSEAEAGDTAEKASAEAVRDLTLEHEFEVQNDGVIAIEGAGGQQWNVAVIADQPPRISATGLPELTESGALSLPFLAQDDYGVMAGEVRISLDHAAVQRRHGLAAEPEPRAEIVLDLPMSLKGERQEFSGFLIEDFAKHPWANLPVVFTFTVQDAAGQSTTAAGLGAPLLAPRFFDPLAASVAEQRRDLLWSGQNARRVVQIMRTLSHRPAGYFRAAGHYLQMRGILHRLEGFIDVAPRQTSLVGASRDEITAALWELAQSLEDGDIGDALARMQQARERLSQAMRDGASDEEIAHLMQKLREATQDYMRQLQRQAQRDGQSGETAEGQDNAMTLSQQDLQAMMDHIQDLMEQGRMAEAEQALEEFQRMMENMRMTQSQQSQEGRDGQQAMRELGETLREQQGLSDRAFRDLQEQFNPNAQAGQSRRNEGRNGGQGRGQQHEGGDQPGAGQSGAAGEGQSGAGQQQGQQQGQSGQPGDGDSTARGSGAGSEGGAENGNDLAGRQQALREELRRQQQGLSSAPGDAGQATREALDRAGDAMREAEDAIRNGDLAEAIDRQSDAMEALREGMRALGEALAQDQQGGQQSGQGQMSSSSRMDPLGRDLNAGGAGDEDQAEVGEGRAYRRAWDLLEELRRRAADKERDAQERGYFERLLDRF